MQEAIDYLAGNCLKTGPVILSLVLSAAKEQRRIFPSREILRCAQDDTTVPILVVKTHYGPTNL